MTNIFKQVKTTEIKSHFVGTPYAYFTLICRLDDKIIRVHTSKNYGYIIRLSRAFQR